jgi:hypothetical protein
MWLATGEEDAPFAAIVIDGLDETLTSRSADGRKVQQGFCAALGTSQLPSYSALTEASCM